MSVSPFRERITTEQELRDLMGVPGELVAKKAIDHLDSHCREFIGRSPFLLVATADATGACDVSPRGMPPVLCTLWMIAIWWCRSVPAIVGWILSEIFCPTPGRD